jgi:ABC-type Fe3+/spermidine/putrescine transport system ATPase subunit
VFVADFLGVSNLLGATAVGQDGAGCTVQVGDRTLRAQRGATSTRGDVKVMIRPERIAIEPHSATGEERMPGIVERSVFLGGSYEVHIRVLGGELLRAMVPNDGSVAAATLESGAAVSLHLPPDGLRVLRTSEPADETDGP